MIVPRAPQHFFSVIRYHLRRRVRNYTSVRHLLKKKLANIICTSLQSAVLLNCNSKNNFHTSTRLVDNHYLHLSFSQQVSSLPFVIILNEIKGKPKEYFFAVQYEIINLRYFVYLDAIVLLRKENFKPTVHRSVDIDPALKPSSSYSSLAYVFLRRYLHTVSENGRQTRRVRAVTLETHYYIALQVIQREST